MNGTSDHNGVHEIARAMLKVVLMVVTASQNVIIHNIDMPPNASVCFRKDIAIRGTPDSVVPLA